ncbi:MAG TPA: hypothetical protein VEH53_06860 [archaeon]|nr:hypothetical protein [archaeon]
MRYGYWWIAVLVTLVFVVALFGVDFMALRAALYTDVLLLGILLVISALVGLWYLCRTKPRRSLRTRCLPRRDSRI